MFLAVQVKVKVQFAVVRNGDTTGSATGLGYAVMAKDGKLRGSMLVVDFCNIGHF